MADVYQIFKPDTKKNIEILNFTPIFFWSIIQELKNRLVKSYNSEQMLKVKVIRNINCYGTLLAILTFDATVET
jgi:hypothetical protein